MKIAALVEPKRFEMLELDRPQVRSRDVLIRVQTCGVCTGELEVWAREDLSNYPLYLGHEVAGEVIEVGPEVTEVKPGDLVAAINEHHGFAEYCATPVETVVKVPAQIAIENAIGEPVACAVNAARRVRADYQDTVVLIGSGFMGLLLMQCLKARSPKRIIAIDTRTEAVERARRFGADVALNLAEEDVKAAIHSLTDGKGADIVVEATGTQPGLSLAGDLVKTRGHLVIYGFHQGAKREVDVRLWNWKGLDVTNAHERDPLVYAAGLRAGLDLVAQGRVNLADLITHRFSLADINQAFELAHSKTPGYVKATVDVQR